MSEFCIICGSELVEGKCPNAHGVKKMCLNCIWHRRKEEGFVCTNEVVLKPAYEKMMAALPEGFEVEVIQLKPMALKNPCKKCGNHEFDGRAVATRLLDEADLLEYISAE